MSDSSFAKRQIQRHLNKPTLALLSSFSMAVFTATASEYQATYVPASDGQWEIECICAVPSATGLQCGLKVLDAAAGSPRHTWRQTVAGRKGKRIDLSAACHRKRDEDKLGAGLCCVTKTDANISSFFAAKVLDPVKISSRPAE